MFGDLGAGQTFELVEHEDLPTFLRHRLENGVELLERFALLSMDLGRSLGDEVLDEVARNDVGSSPTPSRTTRNADRHACRVAPELAYGELLEPVPPLVELNEHGLETVLDVRLRNSEATKATPNRTAHRLGTFTERGRWRLGHAPSVNNQCRSLCHILE